MNKTTRNNRIDFLKAIGTILVVIGHEIQSMYAPEAFDSNVLFRYIYAFHMPLFFMVSGWLLYKKDKEYDIRWLKGKFMALSIPFVNVKSNASSCVA